MVEQDPKKTDPKPSPSTEPSQKNWQPVVGGMGSAFAGPTEGPVSQSLAPQGLIPQDPQPQQVQGPTREEVRRKYGTMGLGLWERDQAEDRIRWANFQRAARGDVKLHAKAHQLGIDLNAPSALVAQNLEAADLLLAQRKAKYFNEHSQHSAVLRRMLLNPEFAALAYHDLDWLDWLEGAPRFTTKGSYVAERGKLWEKVIRGEKLSDPQYERLDELDQFLRGMPSASDFWSWERPLDAVVYGAAEQFGLMSHTLPTAGAGAGVGAVVGGGIGLLVAGPPGGLKGASLGMKIGGAGGMWYESYRIEAGNMMGDLVEMGYSEEDPYARTLSAIGGALGGALEVTGFGFVSAPARRALKDEVRAKLRGEFRKLTLEQAKRRGWQSFGLAVGVETLTETVQEGIAIGVEELTMQLSPEKLEDPVERMPVVERLVHAALEGFTGAIGIGAGTTTFGYYMDRRRVKKAEKDQNFYEALGKGGENIDLAEMAPDAYGKYFAQVADEAGVPNAYVDGKMLLETLEKMGLSREDLRRMAPSADKQLDEAIKNGEDVVIPMGELAQGIMRDELGAQLKPHLKTEEGADSLYEIREKQKEVEKLQKEKLDEALEKGTDEFRDQVKALREKLQKQVRKAADDAGIRGVRKRDLQTQVELIVRQVAIGAYNMNMTPDEWTREFLKLEIEGVGEIKDLVKGSLSQDKSKYDYSEEDKSVANATARAWKRTATAEAAIKLAPTFMPEGGSVLDFGSGPQADPTTYYGEGLRSLGYEVVLHDFGKNLGPEHDANALARQYGLVIASNVVNVQSSERMLDRTLDDIAAAVDDDGRVILNLPLEARKGAYDGIDAPDYVSRTMRDKPLNDRLKREAEAAWLEGKLRERFTNVERVGGSKQAPIFMAWGKRSASDILTQLDFDQDGAYTFDEGSYRDSVVSFAKEFFGDRVAPNGKPVWQNFTRWFGDSKAVDDQGRPVKVFHGTKAQFSEFQYRYMRYGLFGLGIYTTESTRMAGTYSSSEGGVLSLFAKVENPIDMDGPADVEAWKKAFPVAAALDLWVARRGGKTPTNEEVFRLVESLMDLELHDPKGEPSYEEGWDRLTPSQRADHGGLVDRLDEAIDLAEQKSEARLDASQLDQRVRNLLSKSVSRWSYIDGKVYPAREMTESDAAARKGSERMLRGRTIGGKGGGTASTYLVDTLTLLEDYLYRQEHRKSWGNHHFLKTLMVARRLFRPAREALDEVRDAWNKHWSKKPSTSIYTDLNVGLSTPKLRGTGRDELARLLTGLPIGGGPSGGRGINRAHLDEITTHLDEITAPLDAEWLSDMQKLLEELDQEAPFPVGAPSKSTAWVSEIEQARDVALEDQAETFEALDARAKAYEKWDDLSREHQKSVQTGRTDLPTLFQDGLLAMGHDGITHLGGGRVSADGERHQVWIPFHAENVKSQQQPGNYDPESRDILKQEDDPSEAAVLNQAEFLFPLNSAVEALQVAKDQGEKTPETAQEWREWVNRLVRDGEVKEKEVEWSGFRDVLDEYEAQQEERKREGKKPTPLPIKRVLKALQNGLSSLVTVKTLSEDKKTGERTMGVVLKEPRSKRGKAQPFAKDPHESEAGTNVLVHVRVRDRKTPDGRRILFVEEIGSEWAQDIKEHGVKRKAVNGIWEIYTTDSEGNEQILGQAEKEEDVWTEVGKRGLKREEGFLVEEDGGGFSWGAKDDSGVSVRFVSPDISETTIGSVTPGPVVEKRNPSKGGWVSLAMKKIILQAVNENYDGVAIARGDQAFEGAVGEGLVDGGGMGLSVSYAPDGTYTVEFEELEGVVPDALGGELDAVPEGLGEGFDDALRETEELDGTSGKAESLEDLVRLFGPKVAGEMIASISRMKGDFRGKLSVEHLPENHRLMLTEKVWDRESGEMVEQPAVEIGSFKTMAEAKKAMASRQKREEEASTFTWSLVDKETGEEVKKGLTRKEAQELEKEANWEKDDEGSDWHGIDDVVVQVRSADGQVHAEGSFQHGWWDTETSLPDEQISEVWGPQKEESLTIVSDPRTRIVSTVTRKDIDRAKAWAHPDSGISERLGLTVIDYMEAQLDGSLPSSLGPGRRVVADGNNKVGAHLSLADDAIGRELSDQVSMVRAPAQAVIDDAGKGLERLYGSATGSVRDSAGRDTKTKSVVGVALRRQLKKLDSAASSIPLRDDNEAVVGPDWSMGFWVTDEFRKNLAEGLPFLSKDKVIRGSFSPVRMVITLSKKTNLSTFLHEAGHYFLTSLAAMAAHPQAPDRIREDFQTALDWMGVSHSEWYGMTVDQQRKAHEQWAVTFEKYLQSGQSPAPELDSLFARFRQMLLSVYEALGGIANYLGIRHEKQFKEKLPDLTEEVRQVFDRLLATEDQVDRAIRVRQLQPSFQTREEFPGTDQEWNIYQAQIAQAREQALAVLGADSFKAMAWARRASTAARRALQQEYEEERKKVREEVEKELDSHPGYRVQATLRGQPKDQKMNTEAVQKAVPGIDVRKLGAGKHSMTHREGQMTPDSAALLYGQGEFANGAEMLQALLSLKKKADWIEDRVTEIMNERHAELTTPELIEAAVIRAVHNEARARFVAADEKFLAQSNAPIKSFQRAAEQVARQRLEDVLLRDLSPHRYSVAAGKASRESRRLMRKDPATEDAKVIRINRDGTELTNSAYKAADAKRREGLYNAMAKQAAEAQLKIEKLRRFWRSLWRPDAVIAKTKQIEYVIAARALLGAVGLGRKSYDSDAALRLVAEHAGADVSVDIAETLMRFQNIAKPDVRDLTWGEFQQVERTIDILLFKAREGRQMQVEGKVVSRKAAIAEMTDVLEPMKAAKALGVTDEGETESISREEREKSKLKSLPLMLRRVEHWASLLGAPFTRYIYRPVKDAANRYRKALEVYVGRYVKALESIKLPGSFYSKTLKHTFNGEELIGMLLHGGNKSNLTKNLVGNGWTTFGEDGKVVVDPETKEIDFTMWREFLQELWDSGHITQEHMDFVQFVWNLNNELKPQIQKVHRQLTGHFMEEVKPTPFQTPWGEYAGGYVPARPDFVKRPRPDREMVEDLDSEVRGAFPATANGFTITRDERFTHPLDLSLTGQVQHLDQVLRYIHLQPVVSNIDKMLNDPALFNLLESRQPGVVNGLLKPWLVRSVRQQTLTSGNKELDKILKFLKTWTGANIMFGNIRNAIQQTTGLFIAAVKVKPTKLLWALGHYMLHRKDVVKEINGKSVQMQRRAKNNLFDMIDSLEHMVKSPSKFEQSRRWVQRHSYFMQTFFQNHVDRITWLAARDQFMEDMVGDYKSDKELERDAVAHADAVVRQTQGSLDPEDRAAYESAGAFSQLVTQFSTYFNMLANLNADEYIRIQRELGWGPEGFARAAFVSFFGMLAPALAAELIVQSMGGSLFSDDEEDQKEVALDLWLSVPRQLMGMLPGFGQIGGGMLGLMTKNPWDDRMFSAPAFTTLESFARGTGDILRVAKETLTGEDGKEVTRTDVKDASTVLSLLMRGLPVTPLAKRLGYMRDVSTGELDPSSTADYIRGILTGVASPQSR